MDQASDPEGFSIFVRASLPRLVLHVVKLGATLSEAEDAVGEALADAYGKWDSIRSPAAWVRQAAGRYYVHAARRDREQALHAVEGGYLPPSVPPLDGLAVCGEETASVLRHLRRLPPRQREVMAWTYDGYQPAEIAELIGCPESTVRSHLRHARQRLRELILPERGKGEPR